MGIAEFSIREKVVTWMIIIVLSIGGWYAYEKISRLEDPEFTIKEAMVITPYPGANPYEVEEEVTEYIERAVQQLPQLKRVTSISKPGRSEVTVVIEDSFDKRSLPQVWDELRRKINDIQGELPPGAGPSIVNDDYGDVYGMYYALTGGGYSYRELENIADMLKRELLLVPGVAKIVLSGIRKQVVYLDISMSRLSQLGMPPDKIFDALSSQNFVTDSGYTKIGDEYIRIYPTGSFKAVQDIGNVYIGSTSSKNLIHINDVAKVKRDYLEVPSELMRYDDQPALGIGISFISDENVVKVGEAIEKRLQQLQTVIPTGADLHSIYAQPKIVEESVNGFVVSLLQALAIVVVVLLIFMGLRSGIVIASILLLTVLGTLLFMYAFGISLQRISLGALIIALGMLVDNAIVVAEGILIKMQKGMNSIRAANETVTATKWPLFGATIVGILAFAAISMSQDSTGEYTRSLFQVIAISLLLSWVLAITVTPLFCDLLLKSATPPEDFDPYDRLFFRAYRGFLEACIKVRWFTMLMMVGLLAASVYGFGYVKQSFFPDSTTPIFLIDYWRAQGTDIRETSADMENIEKHIQKMPGVESVTSVIGTGAQRFMLVYTPEKPNTSYGQFIVRVKDYRDIDKLSDEALKYLAINFPESEPKVKKIRLGPGKDAKIEVRFSGSDPKVLRQLSEQAKDIMYEDPEAINIRDDWRQQVKVLRPVFNEAQGRWTGITRPDLTEMLLFAFTGKQVGLYREGDKLLPIYGRLPDYERLNIDTINNLQIWSPGLSRYVPIKQVVDGFATTWADDKVSRRNRIRTVTTSCDPEDGLASVLLERLMPKLEAMELPPGYAMEWGGEYEDSRDAQVALAAKLPLTVISMILVVILLFRRLKQPAIIWLCVPLAFVGVTIGLLVTGQPFGFMALLGFLSLSGMLIKNAIVLIDQIDIEIKEGKDPYQAIVDSAVSRVRPVSLAAVTTVLGMIPLLFDAFFVAMAVVIMFGLTFATVLTLIVVPVLYAIFFHVKKQVVKT